MHVPIRYPAKNLRSRFFSLLPLALFSLLFACHKDPAIDKPAWQEVTDSAIAIRIAPFAFAIGTKAYFGLGHRYSIPIPNTGNVSALFNDFWELDITTKKWQKLTDFPAIGRAGGAAFSSNGRGYIIGGYTSTCYKDGSCDVTDLKEIWEYNPDGDRWKLIDTMPGMAQFTYTRSLVIEDQVYLMTGLGVFKFDPFTHQITTMNPFSKVAFSAGSFVINGKGYTFLGDLPSQTKEVYEYNQKSDTWARKNDFPGEPRGFMTAFSLDGYGYIIGSYKEGNPYTYYKDCWQYDPKNDQWTRLDDYPGAGTDGMQSIVIGNTAVIGFGHGQRDRLGNMGYSNDVWLFQPK